MNILSCRSIVGQLIHPRESRAGEAFNRLLVAVRHGRPDETRHHLAELHTLGFEVEPVGPGLRLVARKEVAE
jgi:hypothetical protein